MIITQEKALVQMTGHPLEKIKKDMSRAVWKSTSESFLGDDVAALAPSSGEERTSPRHQAGVASMAWRSTWRCSANAPRSFDFRTGPGIFIFRRMRPSSTA